jgi:hypothetical protein
MLTWLIRRAAGFTGNTVMVLDQATKQREAMLAIWRQLYPATALFDQCLPQLLLQFTQGQDIAGWVRKAWRAAAWKLLCSATSTK